MLEPGRRRLLLDALRPPSGYRLDRAVGTSYSLDLLALLTAPLAFTFFDWEDDEGRPTADPLALLEAVRRHAERIHLFCQGGRVEVPKPGQPLYGYLEGSVFEVAPPHPGGSFHPKAWFLRFTAGEDEPVRYRMLCLSRNLTFDRSWDTSLVLDGELRDRRKAIAANHPLGDFLAALPGMSVGTVPDAVRAGIDRMQEEIRRVQFEFPEHVDEMAFHPLGLEGEGGWPFEEGSRVLVASPFVDDVLGDLAELGAKEPATLVSRAEELRGLEPAELEAFEPVYVMVPEADPEDADEEAAADEEPPSEEGSAAAQTRSEEDRLAGLHAKLFVVERGRRARVYTGSANATRAALERNVELLVELGGTRRHLGIEALLGEAEGSGAGFRDLLEEFRPPEETARPDPEEVRLEREVDGLRLALARQGLRAHVEPDAREESFAMVLEAPRGLPSLPAEGSLRAWPITLHGHAARPLAGEEREAARFEGLSFDALTAFFAFEAELRRAGFEKRARFVLTLPLEGAPRDRRERILRSLLKDRDQVMRLLWLLLSQEEISAGDMGKVVEPSGGERPYGAAPLPGFPLLERLLQALDRDPGRLDEIARLVEDLERTPEGRELLPERLPSVWEPVWQVRRGGQP